MSEYSTDDLVKWVEGIAPGFHECCPPFAIIARLRAADKLCEAATTATDRLEYWGLTRPIHNGIRDALRKAIAGYEGKEET